MRVTRRCALAVLLAGLGIVPALAIARTMPVKTGYYASLVGVRSGDVEFHVRAHNAIPDLTLTCAPSNPAWTADTSYANISVHVPRLAIHNGSFHYHGSAKVTSAYFGAPKITTSSLVISAHHVNGPVHYYTFEGRHLHETTAWRGTVSSPACKSVPAGGHFTLFGPVPGE